MTDELSLAADFPPVTETEWRKLVEAALKGADFDKAYINHEVAAHQGVQALLMTAQSAAQDTTLKALIIKAQPTIDAHLKKAQDIQSKMNATASAAPGMGDTGMAAPKKGHAKKK